jgi:UDP-glucose 6-dehydrogenase
MLSLMFCLILNLAEGTAANDLLDPDRILIGEDEKCY